MADYDEQQHERIMHQRDIIERLIEDNTRYRAALLLIREHRLPYSGFSIDNGSNGVRDLFISVAAKALE